MNCQEFQDHVVDLAGDRVDSVALRTSLLEHVGDCQGCASRMADQQRLSLGLRALASQAAQAGASERVEQTLRQEFRKRSRPMNLAPAVKASATRTTWRKTSTWVGLAASVLLLVGWTLTQLNRETGIQKTQLGSSPKPGTDFGVKPADPVSKTTPEKPAPAVLRPTRPAKTPPPRLSKPVAEQRVQVASKASGKNEQRRMEAEDSTADHVETEFLPFMALGPQFPTEQRQFVRVKLPRSALQVFGLPMNMERMREPVQADVLLGEDGRALAVRFVRD